MADNQTDIDLTLQRKTLLKSYAKQALELVVVCVRMLLRKSRSFGGDPRKISYTNVDRRAEKICDNTTVGREGGIGKISSKFAASRGRRVRSATCRKKPRAISPAQNNSCCQRRLHDAKHHWRRNFFFFDHQILPFGRQEWVTLRLTQRHCHAGVSCYRTYFYSPIRFAWERVSEKAQCAGGQ